MGTVLSPRLVLFGAFAVAVYLTAAVLGGHLAVLPNGHAVSVGVVTDLAVLVPCAYYALVVRPRQWPLVAVVPAVLAGVLLARTVLPAGYRGSLQYMEVLGFVAEAALLGWVACRAGRALRSARTTEATDPLSQLHASARAVVPGRAATVLAAELGVAYYGLVAWRARAHVPPGAEAFTTHRRSGHGGLVFALLLITGVEGLVVHLLLAGRSAAAAWSVTALSVYGAFWLVADYRATVLAPLAWDGTALCLRSGLRWRARVARGQIAGVSRAPLAGPGRGHSVAFLTEPNVWIECASPVVLEGPYGIRRETTRVGLFVDEPDRLVAALTGQPAA
jgi:hypothetical protein